MFCVQILCSAYLLKLDVSSGNFDEYENSAPDKYIYRTFRTN
jgi:hypothetical protein